MADPNRIAEPADQCPTEALRFNAPLQFAAEGEGDSRKRRLRGVAYSGEVIAPHFYWGAVIFDLATTTAPPRVPVLIEHDRTQRVGFASLTISANSIDIADGELLDTDLGRQVAAEADAGFPWQLSVHIEPTEVQVIGHGESAVVNGHKVNGPAHVFRQSRIREVSLTPTGADHRTHAAVFSAAPTIPTTEVHTMSDQSNRVAELEAQVAQLQGDLTAVTAERDAARAEVAQFSTNARTAEVRALFAAIGREFSDDAAKPYLAMDAQTFAVIASDLRAGRAAPPANLPPTLFSETATNGTDAGALDPHKFAADIRDAMAQAKQKGIPMTFAQAVEAARAPANR